MNLQEKLDAQKKEFESSASKEAVEVMHRATEDLAQSDIMNQVKREGDEAPNFSLNNAYGKTVELKSRLSEGPVVLGFYRGRW